jgi:putative endonuclease
VISFLYRFADAARHRRRLRLSTREQANGRRGEDLAHRYLRRHGLTIVARNYRPLSGSGELDIVGWHGSTLVFVEVKTRTGTEFGEPERAIGPDKENDLRRAAGDYLRRAGLAWKQARFDVVSIVLSDLPTIDWVRDAFPVARTL